MNSLEESCKGSKSPFRTLIIAVIICFLFAGLTGIFLHRTSGSGIIKVTAIFTGVYMIFYMAVIRHRLFLSFIAVALAAAVLVNSPSILLAPKYFNLNKSSLQNSIYLDQFVHLQLPWFLEGKTVITGKSSRYTYLIQSFAREMQIEDISVDDLRYWLVSSASHISPMKEHINLICWQYNGFYGNSGPIYKDSMLHIWADGLEDADTIVLLDTPNYDMYLMSESAFVKMGGNLGEA